MELKKCGGKMFLKKIDKNLVVEADKCFYDARLSGLVANLLNTNCVEHAKDYMGRINEILYDMKNDPGISDACYKAYNSACDNIMTHYFVRDDMK